MARRYTIGDVLLAETNLMNAAALYGRHKCAAYRDLLEIAAVNYERVTRSMRPQHRKPTQHKGDGK